jgi:bifunctional DNA-binding transcriptional regulator/antitoxin component of YhaV-PrlF toxin-antitoxin module
MAETRIRRDGCIRVPEEIYDALGMFPGSKIRITLEGKRIVIEKVEMAEDPFAAAAKGPDTSAIEKIQQQQKEAAQRARDRFKELMENPPEIKPEDNPDLWR